MEAEKLLSKEEERVFILEGLKKIIDRYDLIHSEYDYTVIELVSEVRKMDAPISDSQWSKILLLYESLRVFFTLRRAWILSNCGDSFFDF